MEISAVVAIADAVSSAGAQGVCLSKSILQRPSHAAASVTLSILTASAAVRSHPYRSASAPRALVCRTRRRTRRRSSEDGEEDGFSGDGEGDDGPFGGGGGGGGGRGWGFGSGSGRPDWEEESEPSSLSADPAFDFVYEVVCWIALSNCTHFAFRKVGRFLKGKVYPVRLVPSVC